MSISFSESLIDYWFIFSFIRVKLKDWFLTYFSTCQYYENINRYYILLSIKSAFFTCVTTSSFVSHIKRNHILSYFLYVSCCNHHVIKSISLSFWTLLTSSCTFNCHECMIDALMICCCHCYNFYVECVRHFIYGLHLSIHSYCIKMW